MWDELYPGEREELGSGLCNARQPWEIPRGWTMAPEKQVVVCLSPCSRQGMIFTSWSVHVQNLWHVSHFPREWRNASVFCGSCPGRNPLPIQPCLQEIRVCTWFILKKYPLVMRLDYPWRFIRPAGRSASWLSKASFYQKLYPPKYLIFGGQDGYFSLSEKDILKTGLSCNQSNSLHSLVGWMIECYLQFVWLKDTMWYPAIGWPLREAVGWQKESPSKNLMWWAWDSVDIKAVEEDCDALI